LAVKEAMRFDYQGRLTRLRGLLTREKLDALIVVTIEGSSQNVRYLSGFGGTVGALVVSKNDAVLAVDARYTLRAQEEARTVRIVDVAAKRDESFLPYVSAALEAAGASGRIGYEGNRIPVLMARAWEEKYPGLVPTRHLVESLREVKDDDEIVCLREAAQKTTEAFLEILPKVVSGARECDIATELDINIRRHGALRNSFATIVASGPNAASPHHETGERAMQAGESVVVDFGGLYPGGYCSDITRTVFVPGAEPDPELVKVYRTVLGANIAAREAMKAGMLWKDYDAVARAYITERGYGDYFGHGLGHSVGLEVHDVFDYSKSAFQIGTVMTDEPGIYLPLRGGVRIEDMLVLTDHGAEILNPTPYLSYEA
jgi:Xaa-Pro aminopeptidase